MKKEKTNHPSLKLQLHRETLQALEPPELAGVAAGVTSACKSGWTCCIGTCGS